MHRIRILTFLAAAVFFLTACGPLPNSGEDTPAGGDFTYVPDTTRAADLSALGYRSVWFSYFAHRVPEHGVARAELDHRAGAPVR